MHARRRVTRCQPVLIGLPVSNAAGILCCRPRHPLLGRLTLTGSQTVLRAKLSSLAGNTVVLLQTGGAGRTCVVSGWAAEAAERGAGPHEALHLPAGRQARADG